MKNSALPPKKERYRRFQQRMDIVEIPEGNSKEDYTEVYVGNRIVVAKHNKLGEQFCFTKTHWKNHGK